MSVTEMNHASDQAQPLELILARNLGSIISLAAVLVDAEGRIVFYNDAAAQLVGEPFEEIGTMTRDEWNAPYGPVDEQGGALAADELPLAAAVREGRPAYARFRIRAEHALAFPTRWRSPIAARFSVWCSPTTIPGTTTRSFGHWSGKPRSAGRSSAAPVRSRSRVKVTRSIWPIWPFRPMVAASSWREDWRHEN